MSLLRVREQHQNSVESKRIRAQQILEALSQHLSIRDNDFAALCVAKESFDPFRVLVVTILSQNCTDIAALRAYRTLDQQVGVNAFTLSRTRPREIAKAIRAAGLHKQKARGLKRLSRIIVERYSANLDGILNQPLDQARTLLQELPQVGPKTADVLLSVWGQPTISVDTHVNRVSKRLGLARQKARYEEVRATLMKLYEPENYRSVPLLFMAHGRKLCKAPKPRCFECPIEKMCSYPKKIRQVQNARKRLTALPLT
jgi:endonuclease-3